MTDREARSSSQQIMYCYGANRRAEAPARLLVVGLTGRQAQALGNVSGVESWRGASVDERPVWKDGFCPDRSSLVYLTAESETVLEEGRRDDLDTRRVSDRNWHKGATHAKLQLGRRTARLLIGDDAPIVLGGASRVLAVNRRLSRLMVRAQSSTGAAAAA